MAPFQYHSLVIHFPAFLTTSHKMAHQLPLTTNHFIQRLTVSILLGVRLTIPIPRTVAQSRKSSLLHPTVFSFYHQCKLNLHPHYIHHM